MARQEAPDRSRGFRVRPLRAGDAPDLSAFYPLDMLLDDIAEQVAEDLEDQRRGLALNLVAEVGGVAVATAKATFPERTPGDAWTHNVVTHPDYRGLGLATRIIARLADAARERGAARLCAHVRSTNAPARRAYEKAGMRCAGADGMRGEQLRYEMEL